MSVINRVGCCRRGIFGFECHLDDGRRGHLFLFDGTFLLHFLLFGDASGCRGGVCVLFAIVVQQSEAIVVLLVAQLYLVLNEADDVR